MRLEVKQKTVGYGVKVMLVCRGEWNDVGEERMGKKMSLDAEEEAGREER